MVDMNLVSLIDVFTILIFFLLSSAGGVETIASPRAVKLPESMSQKAPKETLLVVVTGSEILVGGRVVASVADALKVEDDIIVPLKAELDVEASRQVIRKENESRQQARDDHGRQGHPVSPAAQGDGHRGALRLHRRLVRGSPEVRP